MNQQLERPTEETGGVGEREAVLAGRWSTPKQQMAQDGVRCPGFKHDGAEEGKDRHSQEAPLNSQTTKVQQKQSQRNTAAFICPCHTYKELVQQIHELPLTIPECDPPSALSASRFRPAVTALAASGAELPHFNASDIYLECTTGGMQAGGDDIHHRGMTILCCAASCECANSTPLLLSSSSSLLCFAEGTTCSDCCSHSVCVRKQRCVSATDGGRSFSQEQRTVREMPLINESLHLLHE